MGDDDRTYIRRILPYRTSDDRIDGVVVTFTDITERKLWEQEVQRAREFAESIVETVREPLLVLTADLRVRSANRSFYRAFEVTREGTEGRMIYELGNHQWDIPRLRELLDEILPEDKQLTDFEVEHEFEQIGRRTMLLNARQIELGRSSSSWPWRTSLSAGTQRQSSRRRTSTLRTSWRASPMPSTRSIASGD